MGFVKVAHDMGASPEECEQLLKVALDQNIQNQFPEKYAEGYNEIIEKIAQLQGTTAWGRKWHDLFGSRTSKAKDVYQRKLEADRKRFLESGDFSRWFQQNPRGMPIKRTRPSGVSIVTPTPQEFKGWTPEQQELLRAKQEGEVKSINELNAIKNISANKAPRRYTPEHNQWVMNLSRPDWIKYRDRIMLQNQRRDFLSRVRTSSQGYDR